MIGQSIGSYRIVSKLGEGGMGAVYLGEHLRIARKAAIKVLLPELSANKQIVARFFNEARATSLIQHPGIVEIIDCDVLPSGNAFIVMEHLVGESLGGLLRRGERLSVPRAAFMARHVADALAAAHEKRIVHRDLKPDNVFVLAAGPQPIKILDFGIAKLMHTDHGEGSYKTRTGSLLGTPVYMSPEQCRGVGDIDHRTDIYSLGCMLFEMLCGRPPFTSEGFGELIQSHLSVAPPPLRSAVPSAPKALDDLVARMLAKPPGDRPQTMAAVMTELDGVIAGGPAMTAAVGEPAAPPPRTPTPLAPLPTQSVLPTPPSARQPATMQIPRVQTTLRSASSENIDVVEYDIAPVRASRRGPALAVAVVVLAVGGIGVWRASVRPTPLDPPPGPTTHGPSDPLPNPERAKAETPEEQPKPQPPPPPEEQPKPQPHQQEQAQRQPQPQQHPERKGTREKRGGRSQVVTTTGTVAPLAAAARIKVAIASEPPGADVCLASDHVLLGRTDFEWSAEKGAPSAKFLIRKRGYRGQELTIGTDRDSSRQVRLYKLGPDDIDDTDNCRR